VPQGLQGSYLRHWFWESQVSFYDQNAFRPRGYCGNALVITTASAFLMRERSFARFRSKQANFIRVVRRCECMKQISNRQYNSVVVTKLN